MRGLSVLVVRIGAMGDVLHALPAVAGLRRLLPECRIGWAVEPRWAPLLAHDGEPGPIVDRVHATRTREWRSRPLMFQTGAEIAELRGELRGAGYDVCVDLQGSIKSAVVGRMAGAPRFLGPVAPREKAAGSLYRERIPLHGEHVIDQACELLGAAAGAAIQPGAVVLPVDDEAEGWCSAALTRLAVTGPFALLTPGAGWGAKEWGTARFGELAARLQAKGLPVVVNAGLSDPGLAATTLSSTLPQLIALTRRAALVIGGDTGPVHLAAALGIPSLALFGPTDPRRNGPAFPGARVRVLRHPASATSHKRTPDTEPGLAQITVDEVEAAAMALVGGLDG